MRRSILAAILATTACAGVAPKPRASVPATAPMRTPPTAGEASQATKAANAAVLRRLAFTDRSDFEDAQRDRLAFIKEDAIRNKAGKVVWAIPQFAFLDAPAPDTVNPSLWRQSQLAAHHGLFKVTDGVYQVRGYDLSVMSIIEGKRGWIIVDPLTSNETAAAALKLVNDTLGSRPVTAMLYTHSHADHFGGARGVLSPAQIDGGTVPIYAPVGFSKNAVAENLIAGNHMSRRATLMFGSTIPRSPTGHVGAGLGPGLPNGTISLVLPTEEIEGRGTRRVIDGIVFEFIDAAGTEAPAEFMFYLPQKRALCTAEVATATFHNVLTPRGAKVRDARAWSRSIDHVLRTYGAKSDVVFASHHWPTWGTDNVQAFLQGQRDIYRYVHDQTVRHANAGAGMTEAAEAIPEPAFQANGFDTRGYYGTLNHNAKAVYQYYFGWWDGVPADYHRHPRTVTAKRYVDAMGGPERTLRLGQNAFAEGDYRWAAEVLNHLAFAEAGGDEAKQWLAAAYEQLGFQAESGAWRSYYLVAAAELRRGVPDGSGPRLGREDFVKAVPSLELFDALAARFNPAKMQQSPYALVFRFPDQNETITLLVQRSVIVPREGTVDAPAATVIIDRADFNRLVLRAVSAPALMKDGKMKVQGDPKALGGLFAALDQPPYWFNVVTP